MKSHVVGYVVALALACVAGNASADTVTMQSQVVVNGTPDMPITSGFVGVQNGLTVTTTFNPSTIKTTTIVGAFGWQVTASSSSDFLVGENLYGYCIQKNGDFYGYPSSYQFDVNYAVAGSPAGGIDAGVLDTTASLQIQALMSNHWSESLIDDAKAAAFQLAVWEIEYDAGDGGETLGGKSDADYFGNGVIEAAWTGSGTDPTQLATDWLNELTALPSAITSAVALNSSEAVPGYDSNVQDMLVNVVPLPAALPAGLAMLGGMMLARKAIRRRWARGV